MAKETVIGSKFAEKFLGPFRVHHQNRNGSYRLLNSLGEIEPFIFPIEHLRLVSNYKFIDDPEFEVEAILDMHGSGTNTEYLVKWKDSSMENLWIPSEGFRSQAIITKFLKQRQTSNKTIPNRSENVSPITTLPPTVHKPLPSTTHISKPLPPTVHKPLPSTTHISLVSRPPAPTKPPSTVPKHN
jgi:hypothetical protein